MSLDFVLDSSNSVIEVDLELIKEGSVLDHNVALDLHHGFLHVKRHDELDVIAVAVLNLLDEELLESGGIHPGGVNDLARLELEPLLEPSSPVKVILTIAAVGMMWLCSDKKKSTGKGAALRSELHNNFVMHKRKNCHFLNIPSRRTGLTADPRSLA